MASMRNPASWLLMTLALLYLTVSLQVGSCIAVSGSCQNVACGSGLCCSSSFFCGNTTAYCGPGCRSGPCFANASSPIGSPIGRCANNVPCAADLCCSAYNFCGSNSSYCGAGCQSGPCHSNSGGPSLNSSAGFALACMLGTMTLLGTVFWNGPERVTIISWRSWGWLLIFAILGMAMSSQIGVTRADKGSPDGSCINQACGIDLCCSHSFYCGSGDSYCGVGCRGGNCSSPVNATLGSCVNQACALGLCCNANFLCGSNGTDCGVGCQGGPCLSNSGSCNIANAGLAFACVLGTLTFL